MVTAKEFQTLQQFYNRKPPDSDHMALLQLEQNHSLPCFPPTSFGTDVTFPGQDTSVLPPWNISPIIGRNSCMRDSQFAVPQRFGITDEPVNTSRAPQKRFLIFDQSGNQTRLFVSPSFPPHNQNIVSKTPASSNGLHEKVARMDQQFLVKPEEQWDESDLADGEGEMLENTDEIDALLDSDTDDDGEDDEVTSTGHGPFHIGEGYDEDKSLMELMEEVASSDDLPKRQRLLDGSYKKSSIMSANVKPDRSYSYDDDAESSCGGESYDDEMSKRGTKVKIRNALKIIASIIPGSKNNDPLSIIDKAIVYLKTMKIEAETLGLGNPESESATFP